MKCRENFPVVDHLDKLSTPQRLVRPVDDGLEEGEVVEDQDQLVAEVRQVNDGRRIIVRHLEPGTTPEDVAVSPAPHLLHYLLAPVLLWQPFRTKHYFFRQAVFEQFGQIIRTSLSPFTAFTSNKDENEDILVEYANASSALKAIEEMK